MSVSSDSRQQPSDITALVELVSLVRMGLAAQRGESINRPQALLDAGLPDQARRHRLEGFLLRFHDSLNLDGELVATLQQSQLERAQLGLTQWGSTLSLSRLLEAHSIPFVIFKGRALTIQTEAEEDGRGGGDVDLLVPPGRVSETHQLLVASGYLPVYAVEPKTHLGWAFVTYRNREMPYRSERVEIDVHWRISTEQDYLPPTETLIARGVLLGSEGQRFPTLCATDALAACAFHFYYDYASALRRLVDFARLSRMADREVLETLPLRTRQLIADVAALSRELFGESAIGPLSVPEAVAENVGYLRDLFWSGEGSFSHRARISHPLKRALANFHHTARYTSKPSLVARLFARGLVWYPPSTPGQPGWSVPRAFRAQITRVLRGRFDSSV